MKTFQTVDIVIVRGPSFVVQLTEPATQYTPNKQIAINKKKPDRQGACLLIQIRGVRKHIIFWNTDVCISRRPGRSAELIETEQRDLYQIIGSDMSASVCIKLVYGPK